MEPEKTQFGIDFYGLGAEASSKPTAAHQYGALQNPPFEGAVCLKHENMLFTVYQSEPMNMNLFHSQMIQQRETFCIRSGNRRETYFALHANQDPPFGP